MDELAKLKFKRGQLKSQLTRSKNYFNSLKLENLTDEDNCELEVRLEKLEPILSQFEEIQYEIEYILMCASESLDSEADERTEFEASYFQIVSKYKKAIAQNSNRSENDESGSQKTTEIVENRVINSNPFSPSFIKLPDVKPPSFNGDFERWLEFRDAFNSLVHENASITPIHKFYYLKSLLVGEPLELISSIEVCSSNYSVAYSLLTERYENKKLIVHNYVKALFDAPLIRESHSNLRKLYDTFVKNLRSLKLLGLPTDQWDCLVIHLLTSKFDPRTRRDWESYTIKGELPTVDEMSIFLKVKCELLEKLELTKIENKNNDSSFYNNYKPSNKSRQVQEKTRSLATATGRKISCYYCKQAHSIFQCESFRNLDIESRIDKVNNLKLCSNCFDPSHTPQSCEKSNCRLCGKKHNTMIHLEKSTLAPTDDSRSTTAAFASTGGGGDDDIGEGRLRAHLSSGGTRPLGCDVAESDTIVGHTLNNFPKVSPALLSTAIIKIFDTNGKVLYVRALLDPGSQSHFITNELVKKLGLKTSSVNYSIAGVGEVSALSAKAKTTITIGSRINDYTETITCLIIPKITQNMPIFSFDITKWSIPENIELADPHFNTSNKIDILLGVGLFYKLLVMEQINLYNMPTLQNTVLGYIVGGELNYPCNNNRVVSCLTLVRSIEESLNNFWKIEECSDISISSKEDNFCENYFINTFERDKDGRFIVKIPFKDSIKELGDSRNTAVKRFHALERRLEHNLNLKADYANFMNEYLELGHMTKIENPEISPDNKLCYYLPHHAVVKETSRTTRVRIVFDASAKPENGLSLNEIQYTGPTIQDDLLAIILRFRTYKYVLNADISKMYRQILIHPDERRFQRIFWRENSDQLLECYELNTVTYGTSSAPFLAVRCLQQLGIESKENYPLASRVILNDFFMDDLLTGADNLEELEQIHHEVSSILSSGGFQLRKWLSNETKFLESLTSTQNIGHDVIILGENERNKTLGVYWNASADTIQYSINFDSNKCITKRVILSKISQIFDPLGLLQPLTIVAKLMLQRLWQEQLEWDQEVPFSVHKDWSEFCNDLEALNSISVSRCVKIVNSCNYVELHGFADASERAYGACVYVCCRVNDDMFTSKLLCAKSRVAPIKDRVTLPRLELCAAVLLIRLMNKILSSLQIEINECFYWSDSTIALYWLKGCPSRWKTFVANRVATIQKYSNPNQWFHVKSTENPADLVSRGCKCKDLINSKLYWEGPEFLKQRDKINLSSLENMELDNIPDQKIVVNIASQYFDLTFDNFSSIDRLQRTISYCNRFFSYLKNKNAREYGPITALELQQALYQIIRISQMQSFSRDYINIQKKESLQRSSKLLSLNPFMDEHGLLRVGGRLKHANINFCQKHPIILDSKHHITILIMRREHLKLMHCGAQQLLYSVREQYWPISGRRVARTIVRNCVTCFKAKPIAHEYMMGNLPEVRVNQYIPFTNTGIDYAGPVTLKDRQTINPKLIKGYICLFICLSTKCIHLELVTDLTSESFIATLRRFISRRGKPSHMFSDNGTTFVGANSDLLKFLQSNSGTIKNNLASEGITWHFIPPRAPNFGGIWEANIKQVKYHLKRMLGNVSLTYEKFCTVLIQIEGILNSRPISPLSSDPLDLNPLTPAHFLIGKSITSMPEPILIEVPDNRLNQYEHLQKIIQQFWRRWSKEYVGGMQTRLKWKTQSSTYLKVGSLVIIKEDNLPVFQWKVGRVIQLHPGDDQIVRVATVKCSDGSVVKRAVSRLCVLPIDGQISNDDI